MKIDRDMARRVMREFANLPRFPKDPSDEWMAFQLDELMAIIERRHLRAVFRHIATERKAWSPISDFKQWYHAEFGLAEAGQVVSKLLTGFAGCPTQASNDCPECFGTGFGSQDYLVTLGRFQGHDTRYEKVSEEQKRSLAGKLPKNQEVATFTVPCRLCKGAA